MKTYKSVLELIGSTPLVRLERLEKILNVPAKIYGKLEYMNPAGSAKDRAALSMIEDAEKRGILKPGAVIIEPTSGNTGIGLASVAAVKGYKVILTMPDSMSLERRSLLAAYGAQLVLTEGAKGMEGAIAEAKRIASKTPGSIIVGQFENKANPEAHFNTTGPEIWSDLDGQVDCFIACIGTGGTVTGVGRYLKSKNKDIYVIGVEPMESPLISKGYAGAHGIQGIGANFVPKVFDRKICDEIMAVKTQDSYAMAREIAKTEGFLVGISSGAALCAAIKAAEKINDKNKNIVVFFPDSGERYLSSGLYEEK